MIKAPILRFTLPIIVIIGVLLLWFFISYVNLFPAYAFPSPQAVLLSFREEILAGRLVNDIIASLWRVAVGFVLSVLLGVPLGLWLGQHLKSRQAIVPMLNFFRFLSPLAWIPFAILWFHIGDKPAIFLIFMATFFPLALATMVAVATIPSIYFRVAQDYHYKGIELLDQSDFSCRIAAGSYCVARELWYCMGSNCCCRNGRMPGWIRIWNLGSTQWFAAGFCSLLYDRYWLTRHGH